MKWIWLALLATGIASAQGNTGVSMSSPFSGAVPMGQVAEAPLRLTLSDAIRLGLERNLGALLATEAQRSMRGDRLIALSRLLPHAELDINESSQQINLAAYGFPLTGIPSVVGPFGLFDARAKVTQQVFNLRWKYGRQATEQQSRAVDLNVQDARDTVVMVVAALYWQAVAGSSRIAAAQAQVTTAEAVHRQAADQKDAGLVPAIDVLRAQVELQSQRQLLIADQSEFEKQKLRLAEAIGVPSGQRIELADILSFAAMEATPEDTAIQHALETRADYQSQAAKLKSAELARKSIGAVRLPSVAFDGDYGVLGASPMDSHGTFTAKVGVTIPVFAGGAERGAIVQADSEVVRQKALLDEMHARIGFEIRSILLDLKSAADQVEVNQSAVQLAGQQVTQARDRFSAGVTDNLEVVQAQQGLAAANENYIASLYAYNLAKVSLARAMGGTEKNLAAWSSGQGGK